MNRQEIYAAQGYVVIPGLLPPHALDALLRRYEEEIVPSHERFFRQNTSRYERNALTPEGHVRQSFLDIHDYAQHREFSHRALDVFTSAPIREALAEVTGFPSFHL